MDQRQFVRQLRGNMTDAEQLLWLHLRAHRLDGQKFRRQQPLGPYIADFVHFGARLIVEADGGQHNESARDVQRDAWFEEQGFKVLRFWNDDILLRTEAVREVIWRAVAETTPLPQPLSHKGRGE
jgi:very-short-patch-repair endonuclease